jgi:hypothetical protein
MAPLTAATLICYGPAPTGLMPALRGRMIAFEFGSNANWNRSKGTKFLLVPLCVAAKGYATPPMDHCGTDRPRITLDGSHRRMDRATMDYD